MHLFVCIHACLALACFGRQSVAISEATGGLATATAALLFSLLAVCVSNGSSNFVSKHDKATFPVVLVNFSDVLSVLMYH